MTTVAKRNHCQQQELPVEQAFVANYPYRKTEKDFQEMVKPYGRVAHAYLIRNENGVHKGQGFVRYYDDASAIQLVRHLNGTTVDGRRLKVEFSNEFKRQQKRTKNTRLVYGNQSLLNQQQDNRLCNRPAVFNNAVPAFHFPGTTSGHDMNGIAVETDYGVAPEVSRGSFSDVCLRGEPLSGNDDKNVQHAQPHIFLSNVSYNISEQKMSEVFANYGKVEKLSLIPHETLKRHKGYGFVTYEDPRHVARAVNALQGRYMCDRKLDVDFSEWFKKPDISNGHWWRRRWKNYWLNLKRRNYEEITDSSYTNLALIELPDCN